MFEDYCLYTMCNDEYIDACCVMIYSFLKNNSYYNGDIVILHDDKIISLSDENKAKLSKLYGKIAFDCLNYDEYSYIFDNCEKISYKKILCTYYKFEIFKKNKYNKIIWLDSDICVSGSIIDALNVDAGLIGVNFRQQKDKDQRIYFNTGFLIIDKSKIKIKNPCEYLKEKAAHCDINYFTNFLFFPFKGKYGDESVLNEEFENMFDNIVCVDNTYNFMQREYDRKFKESDAKIIHYTGKNKKLKPYIQLNEKSPYHLIWKKYFDEFNSFLCEK